jgi:hypothetical protein
MCPFGGGQKALHASELEQPYLLAAQVEAGGPGLP